MRVTRQELIDIIIEREWSFTVAEAIRFINENYSKNIVKYRPLTYEIDDIEASEHQKTQETNYEVSQNDLDVEKLADLLDMTKDPKVGKFVMTRAVKELDTIISSKVPVNVYCYGESGIGKTRSIIALAKKAGRRVMRVNFSKITDFDDLLATIRLVDGETRVELGPITVAAMTGSIVILDEVDMADPRLISDLNPILEHISFPIKRLNRIVTPKDGFQVIATANTSGRGDGTHTYTGTNVLNKAFLERFSMFVKFEVPNKAELKKILSSESEVKVSEEVVEAVTSWYEHVRTSFERGMLVEHIGIRRLIDICKNAKALGADNPADMKRALELAVSGYADDVTEALCNLWDSMFCATKVDAKVD